MNHGDFLRMFGYDHWANRECLRAMGDGKSVAGSTVGRMAHILSAEKLWLERIQKKGQSLAVWPKSTIQECVELADQMASEWRSYLSTLPAEGLDWEVQYRNSKGEPWSSRVQDVLMHVLMHSAYHRGQVAIEMRMTGVEPAYTDFIHAVRQGFLDVHFVDEV